MRIFRKGNWQAFSKSDRRQNAGLRCRPSGNVRVRSRTANIVQRAQARPMLHFLSESRVRARDRDNIPGFGLAGVAKRFKRFVEFV